MIYINGQLPTVNRFDSGEQNVVISKKLIGLVRKTDHLKLYWRYQDDQEIMQLREILNIFDKISNVEVYIPYFPHERMDRKQDDQANSLSVFLDMLPVYNQSGKIHYQVLEPHSDVLVEIAKNNGLDLKINWFEAEYHGNTKLIVLPDKGSVQRYREGEVNDTLIKFLKEDSSNRIVVGSKSRDFQTHKILGYSLDKQLVRDKRTNRLVLQPIKDPEDFWKSVKESLQVDEPEILLFDDISSYGGTFIRIADKLKEILGEETINLSVLSLRVAHAERAILKGDLLTTFDFVFTTDSIINPADVEGYKDKYNTEVVEVNSSLKYHKWNND